MPDNPEQPQPQIPDQLTDIRRESEHQLDQADAAAALERIRSTAGLPPDAVEEIQEHYTRLITREAEESGGNSDTHQRWLDRQKNPAGWQEVEAKITGDMMVKASRYKQAPQIPPGHPDHRDKAPLQLQRMSEREWKTYKQDQQWWSELSAADKAKYESRKR